MQDLIGKAFEHLGGAMIDPAMVLPAALPLDLCGESIRARLCTFTDHNNLDMALRPDLTLAVALAEVEARKGGGAEGERVHRYHARAFRQPLVAGEALEFMQAGFERFGAEASAQADAQAYGLVSEVSEDAGVQRGVARFGDLGVLPAFIKALKLSDAVSAGLVRAFRQAGGVGAYLARARLPRDEFVLSLVGLDKETVAGRLNERLASEGVQHFGNRSQDEVVERLMDQARHAKDDDVPEMAQSVLEAVLELSCAPEDAAKRLGAIAHGAGLTGAREAIERLEERMSLIGKASPRFLQGAQFSPAFGRRFTYYDGFVFELSEPGEGIARPFGAGGRYDALLHDLSLGEVSATAIGGVVRPDRLALAAEGGR